MNLFRIVHDLLHVQSVARFTRSNIWAKAIQCRYKQELGSGVEVRRRISLANFNQSRVNESRNSHFTLPLGGKCGFNVPDHQKCQEDSGYEAI